MAAANRRHHLSVDAFQTTETFRGARAPRAGSRIKRRARERHGRTLLAQLETIAPQADRLAVEQHALAPDAPAGIYLTFESEPGFELKTESLDRSSAGIELLSVRAEGRRTLATVFVPEGQLPALERLVNDYLEKDNVNRNTGKITGPRNEELIANIRAIRQATLKHLWTDDPSLLPAEADGVIWWEVWLRVGTNRTELTQFFRQYPAAIGLEASGRQLEFPERTVLAVRGTRQQMTRSVHLLNTIAELRKLKETAEFFTGLPPDQQWQWSDDLLQRVKAPAGTNLAVCILDTGMNVHPLLAPALAANDRHTINPNWGTDDAFGHGTQMGALTLYGDLAHVLPDAVPLPLTHRLESVKLPLPLRIPWAAVCREESARVGNALPSPSQCLRAS